MAGRSRATSPIPNCGPSAIIARPGSIICASAIARRKRSARCTKAPWIFTWDPTRCASAACWNGHLDRCAGRKIRRTAPPMRCFRSRPPRAAARSISHRDCGASLAGDAPQVYRGLNATYGLLSGDFPGFLEIAVHHRTAAGAQIGALLHHADGDPRNVRDLGAAEAERVAGTHLLRLGAEGKA